MEFSTEYKPWLITLDPASDEGAQRPVYTYVNVERLLPDGSSRIVATDSFSLVAIPCTLGEADVPGPVWGLHLKQAFDAMPGKGKRRTLPEVFIDLGAEELSIFGGIKIPRFSSGIPSFPNYKSIVPDWKKRLSDCNSGFAINFKRLKKLAEAIGDPEGENLLITRTGRDKNLMGPVLFERLNPTNQVIQLPFGLIMPISRPHKLYTPPTVEETETA